MNEIYEVTYENTDGLNKRKYKSIEEITRDFGLSRREIMSYYSSMSLPKIDCVVKTITKIPLKPDEKEPPAVLVVFE